MKLDEFAFVNQQLAGMLKAGIPLEGALKKLCVEMRSGGLKIELHQLEADLGRGTPLKEALAARKFPELYVKMIQVGVAANHLPGVLTLLADYYQRMHSVRTRLRGLMVYPLIVLMVFLGLSVVITHVYRVIRMELLVPLLGGMHLPVITTMPLWLPTAFITLIFFAFLLPLAIPGRRRFLRWRFPAFHEASLSRLAAAMGLMLQGGCSLKDALALAVELEQGTPAELELSRWQALHAGGCGKLAQIAIPGRSIPPLFCWLISSAEEDPAVGLKRAADLYLARANHRIEVMLYAGLPVAIILLGGMILAQTYLGIAAILSAFASPITLL